MKILEAILIATVICLFSVSCVQNKARLSKEELKVEINSLLDGYYLNADKEEYDSCLIKVDEILVLCRKYSVRNDFIMDMTDSKLSTLMNLGRFDESLKIAFELEKMAQESGDTLKPWYYLKIADSYVGLQDFKKSIDWIGKAVYERQFKNYRFFMTPKYQNLQTDDAFKKLVTVMKDRIGLGHPAKDFTIALNNGDIINLSSQKGKVVLIDFWDVRCAPCIKALPELKSLYEQYHKDGFEIIGISLDTEKDLLSEFLDKEKIPWNIACSYQGWKDDLVDLYGIAATPSTWLIDRNGILQFNEIKGEELKKAVESLL